MKTKIEIKADILKTLMSEDRQEVRAIRSAIYNIISLLTVSSFALSSFILEKKPVPFSANMRLLTDVLIILFIWVFFIRFKIDLYHCRQCLKARQDLINNLDEDDTNDLNPFPNVEGVIPDLRDSELWWLAILATIAISIKMVVIWTIP